MLFILLFGFSGLVNLSVFAQSPPKAVYSISYMPARSGYDATKLNKLNKQLAAARTIDAAKKIIYSENIHVNLTMLEAQPGKALVWWFINTDDKSEKSTEFQILRSKGGTLRNVTRLGGFREIIKDTLLLLDTLSIGVHLNDPGFKDAGFGLEQNCNGTVSSGPVPTDEQKNLLFYPGMIHCSSGYLSVSLFNFFNRDRKLAIAVLTSLNSEQTAMVKAISKDYLDAHPGADPDDFEDFVAAVLREQVASPPPGSLHEWIERNHFFKPR